MIAHLDLYEKLLAERHAHIQHAIQQSRMLAHARQRRRLVRQAVGKLGTVLIALGSQLQGIEQRSEASLNCS